MSRTRSTSTSVPSYIKYEDTTDSGVPVSPPYNSPSYSQVGYTGGNRDITDEVHPGFAAAKRRGEIVMGNCTIASYDRQVSEGSMSGRISAWKEFLHRSGDLIAEVEASAHALTPDLGGQYKGSISSIALIKAYAKMNQSDVMGGEVVRDLSATLGMLRHPFSSSRTLIKKIYKAKRKRLNKSGSNLALASADAWLELRYGWQPIILDIETIVEKSHKICDVKDRILVARGSESNSWSYNREFSNLVVGPGFYWPRSFTGAVNVSDDVAAFAGVIYRERVSGMLPNAAQFFGTRAQDLPALAWELIPYSFVVDWFVNVGDWIQAITPNPNVTVLASWVSTKHKRTLSTSASVTCNTGAGLLTGSAGSSTVKFDTFHRNTQPILATSPVVIRKPLSLIHSIDAASLSLRPILASLGDLFKH